MNKLVPAYCWKVSPRGQRLRLRVSHERGLEVAIPKGYDPANIPDLLDSKSGWIARALQRAERQRQFLRPDSPWQMPEEILLPAVGASWKVIVRASSANYVSIRAAGVGRLVASGAVYDELECRAALGRWLMRQTRERLVPLLSALSVKTGLRYERVVIKRQRTRWASCSRRATVSLNAKLLFLSPELVEYVMTHELCHRVQMNHGKRFWALLSHYSPGHRVHDASLREMWKVIPHWIN